MVIKLLRFKVRSHFYNYLCPSVRMSVCSIRWLALNCNTKNKDYKNLHHNLKLQLPNKVNIYITMIVSFAPMNEIVLVFTQFAPYYKIYTVHVYTKLQD